MNSRTVSCCHIQAFGNYGLWCNHMGVAAALASDLVAAVVSPLLTTAPNSTIAGMAAATFSQGLQSDAARLEVCTDVALFFALWGEATNLRLMPESLCFLFHMMVLFPPSFSSFSRA
jgi:hypothetical protein